MTETANNPTPHAPQPVVMTERAKFVIAATVAACLLLVMGLIAYAIHEHNAAGQVGYDACTVTDSYGAIYPPGYGPGGYGDVPPGC